MEHLKGNVLIGIKKYFNETSKGWLKFSNNYFLWYIACIKKSKRAKF